MIYAEAACLTGILIIGILSAYTDFSTGIIPNKLLLIGMAAGLLFHVTFLLLGLASYYANWLLCMLIADALAFGMFCGKLWAAGDAKLFMVLFFLTPPRLFDYGQLSNGIVPYIFIFLPALIWMLGDSVIRRIRKEPYKKQAFEIKKWLIRCLKTIIEATAIHSIMYALFPSFVENNGLIIFLIIMIYAYFCGTVKVLHNWLAVLIHVLVAIGLWLIMKWTFSLPDWRSYVLLIVVMIVQRFAGMYNYQLIPTSKVIRGMIPAAETVILFQTSRVQNLPKDPSEQLTAKMTEEEASAVRRWESSAKGKDEIWIVRKVPFAFMIAFGFVAWMIFKLVR